MFKNKFKKRRKKRSGQQARPRHPENNKRVAIFFQVPREPLPAVRWDEKVSLGALKRSDQEGTRGEVRRTTEVKKDGFCFHEHIPGRTLLM